jgi:phospholipase/lecithinase/hemolysin
MAVFVLWTVFVFCGGARGGDITGIVSFGDSLTDVGNFFAATGGAAPPSPPYDAGRFSNGPIWVEYLAHDLGVVAPTASSSGGTDYAYGGAMTGTGYTSSIFAGATANVPNIGTQIDTYLASNTPNPNQLFTIWGGANDFLNGGQTNPMVPVSNIGTEIATLASAGGRQFMVANLPLLGEVPYALKYLTPAEQQGLNQLTIGFNSLLQAEVTQLQQSLGVQIHLLDIATLFQNVIANPSQYGFTNVTSDAIDDGVYSGQGYLFWDPIHPTTAGHQIIGNFAAQSVPEPSSLLLLGTSICGLAVVIRLRSRSTS